MYTDIPVAYSAIVWGASAKHARGQKVGLEHVLEDEDGTPSQCLWDHTRTNRVHSRPHSEEVTPH